MALTDILLDNLRLSLPGATDGIIQLEVKNMLDEFCRETLAWRETIEVELEPDEDEYTLTPPAGSIVVDVTDSYHPSYTATSVFTYGVLTLTPVPGLNDIADPLTVELALKPDLSLVQDLEDVVPDWMWGKYNDTFKNGTLYRMMQHVAKPWSNPQMAAYYRRLFFSDTVLVRRQIRGERQIDIYPWRYPRWA